MTSSCVTFCCNFVRFYTPAVPNYQSKVMGDLGIDPVPVKQSIYTIILWRLTLRAVVFMMYHILTVKLDYHDQFLFRHTTTLVYLNASSPPVSNQMSTPGGQNFPYLFRFRKLTMKATTEIISARVPTKAPPVTRSAERNKHRNCDTA